MDLAVYVFIMRGCCTLFTFSLPSHTVDFPYKIMTFRVVAGRRASSTAAPGRQRTKGGKINTLNNIFCAHQILSYWVTKGNSIIISIFFKVINFNQWWSIWQLTSGVKNLATLWSVCMPCVRWWRAWPVWQLNFYCQVRELNDKTMYRIDEITNTVSTWTQQILCKRLLGRNTTVPECVSLLVKYVVCISRKNTFSGGPW
jgi:hypothetical protein